MFTFYVFLMAVSLCTINVNGIAEHPKRERIFKYLLDQHLDIKTARTSLRPDF